MPKCDKCDKEVKQVFRGGRLQFCHTHAHEMGLGHFHRPEIMNATHFLEFVVTKEALAEHLEEYKEVTT